MRPGRPDPRRRLPSVAPLYLAYGADATESLDVGGPSYFVHVPVTGRLVVSGSGAEFVSTPRYAVIASPGQAVTLRWRPDTAAMVFRIDRKALEAALVDLTDEPVEEPLRFQVRMDVTGRLARSWLTTAMFLAAAADHPGGLLDNALVAADLERMLLRGLLLLCQPHTHTAAIAPDGAEPDLPRHAAAAVALMDAAPDRPVRPRLPLPVRGVALGDAAPRLTFTANTWLVYSGRLDSGSSVGVTTTGTPLRVDVR